ncbi:hypothetical protein AWE51_02955 [Aquimarina aggregata]|uniref:Uncharacterized protein n=1 Tax=Aquimarina aggregata TaxID=1642818 RepID=A0A163CHI3_9FLAO|nr:hypothetical protein [Aquimarina aggregata]KZS42417.1 hypothetical protein AWE51_02955 [Aquimarina aggregata]
MSNRKFEILVLENRNGLSKYGGIISLVIIGLLVFGIFWVKIPEYQKVIITTNSVAKVTLNQSNISKKSGDSIVVRNDKQESKVLIIDTINIQNGKTTLFFKLLDSDLETAAYKLIVKEVSLFESLISPFFKAENPSKS